MGQITKARVHGRMLEAWPRVFLLVGQVCDNNGSNFSGLRSREYLCAVER
jgi:hypothetical protein